MRLWAIIWSWVYSLAETVKTSINFHSRNGSEKLCSSFLSTLFFVSFAISCVCPIVEIDVEVNGDDDVDDDGDDDGNDDDNVNDDIRDMQKTDDFAVIPCRTVIFFSFISHAIYLK